MAKPQTKQGYLLGVDTGTSKTHALISDLSGTALGFGASGCGNYEVVGLDGLKTALNNAANEALKTAKVDKREIIGMGFGLSGYDWPSEKRLMVEAIESLGIRGAYQFVNDVMIGLIAGTTDGWGVAVDAGTGNNVRGRDPSGRTGRITGNSARFGELGGAGEMVWQASIAATYAWTQRGPRTEITQLFMDFSETQSEDALIEGLAMDQIHLPPSLALEIIKLAESGDEVAQNVVKTAAQELALNVNAVIRQLNFQGHPFEIVLIGSVFKAGEIYLQPFTKTIRSFAQQAIFIHLDSPPVVGSVILAAETMKIDTPNFRQNVISSSQKLFN